MKSLCRTLTAIFTSASINIIIVCIINIIVVSIININVVRIINIIVDSIININVVSIINIIGTKIIETLTAIFTLLAPRPLPILVTRGSVCCTI